MYKYTHKFFLHLLKTFLKNFERSLNHKLDILKMCSLQYLPSSSLLKMWNNLPIDLKRSNSLSIFKNRLVNSLFENYRLICVINRIAIHVKLIRYVLIYFDICCVHV